MLSSEAGTQRTLLKWIVNLQGGEFKKKNLYKHASTLRITAWSISPLNCNFPLEEVLERQHQTTYHFSQKQCIDAPFKH